MSQTLCRTVLALFAVAASAPAQEKEPRLTGRLPPYFKDVVDAKQKTAIYKIQAEHKIQKKELETRYETLTAEIKKLRADINSLKTAERDAIEKVLTPEQREAFESHFRECVKIKKVIIRHRELSLIFH